VAPGGNAAALEGMVLNSILEVGILADDAFVCHSSGYFFSFLVVPTFPTGAGVETIAAGHLRFLVALSAGEAAARPFAFVGECPS